MLLFTPKPNHSSPFLSPLSILDPKVIAEFISSFSFWKVFIMSEKISLHEIYSVDFSRQKYKKRVAELSASRSEALSPDLKLAIFIRNSELEE